MILHYRQRNYTSQEGNLVSDRYTLYSSENYKIIELDKDYSLDEISLKYYYTPLYYWIIGEVNNIKDPFVKVKKGVKLRIPIL